MCGIIAYLGSEDAFHFIHTSLALLQNRGYDSAGICTLSADQLIVHKFASRPDKNGIQLLDEIREKHYGNTIGIGHTRWATHGAKTDLNAHPHLDSKHIFAVVHNGIIENYLELRQMLDGAGYKCISQTDTEVVPILLEYHYDQEYKRCGGINIDIETNVIQKTISQLRGTWALCILCTLQPSTLYLSKNGSPLVLSYNQDFMLVASEQLPLSSYFTNFITLHDGDIIKVHKNEGCILFDHAKYIEKIIENKISETSCAPYPHWTIKEIQEQPQSIMRTLNMGGRLMGDCDVKLGGIDSKYGLLTKMDHLILLGCGTSYHAGLVGAQMIQRLKCFQHVQCIDASEFTDLDIPVHGKTAFVLLSQSGETKDVHRCISFIRAADCPVISIVNVVGSLLAQESDCGIYLNAGREVGVASTKSFTSQIIAVTLLGMWFSQHKATHELLRTQYSSGLRSLSMQVEGLLTHLSTIIPPLAQQLLDVDHMFILGRGAMKYIAHEGSLKIKEIAYIHAEGYAGGSLKHGPFALIDPKTVVILLAPDDENFTKMIHAASEIHSRHARMILITNSSTEGSYSAALFEKIITVPDNTHFQTILSIIPLQLLAYEVSKAKGYDPDFPRNLAKVVTVDG
jgi:glucosamine--fructose-6-phosphate aminotransferase (isomerizing)